MLSEFCEKTEGITAESTDFSKRPIHWTSSILGARKFHASAWFMCPKLCFASKTALFALDLNVEPQSVCQDTLRSSCGLLALKR